MSKEKQIFEDLVEIFEEEYEKRRLITPQNTAEKMTAKGYRKQNEGEWVDEPNFAQKGLKGKYYVCSNCNVCVPAIEELPLYQWEYCPHCGAKMKGA